MKFIFIFITLITLITGYRLIIYTSPRPPHQFTPNYIRLNQPANIIDQSLKRFFPEPHASLLSGILVGTKAQMPKDFYTALQKTGTMHIIALSGTNISFFIIGVSLILGNFFGKSASSFITIIIIITFIIFVGPSASVVRAGIMGSMQVLSYVLKRQYLAMYGLIISGLLMILIKPEIIFDIGFQLSFAATFGLIMINNNKLHKLHKNFVGRLMNNLLKELKFTLSAQIFTLPIIIYNFHNLSLIAPLTNILIGWTVPYLMSGGFIISFLSLTPLISLTAPIISWFLLPLLNWFISVVNITAVVPISSVATGNVPLWGVYMYYAVLFLIIGIKSFNK